MRFLLGLIAIALIVVIVLVWTGYLQIGGSLGNLHVTGTPPEINANVATVETGTTNVQVPTVTIRKPGDPAPAATATPQ